LRKIFFLLTIVTVALLSRENPFIPSKNANEISNNNQKKYYNFQKDELKLPSSARVLKSVKFTYINVDGSTGYVTKEIDRAVDWHEPIILTHENKEKNEDSFGEFREIELKGTKFIQIYFLDKDFKIKTPFKIKTHTFKTQPFRIVIDFEGIITTTKIEKMLKERYFKKVTVTGHDNFFRIVLELDSYYEHLITKIDGGYMLGVR
jgi:hypothetical protein